MDERQTAGLAPDDALVRNGRADGLAGRVCRGLLPASAQIAASMTMAADPARGTRLAWRAGRPAASA
eukprot:9697415-Alexandrium_andersonii.AAC.1